MSRIIKLQKRLLQKFQSRNCRSSPLFLKLKLLKLNDKVLLEKVLLINKFITGLLLPIFNIWFTFCSNIHNYGTTSSATCELFKPSFHTNLYAKNSITVNPIDAWNKAPTSLGYTILKDLTPNNFHTNLYGENSITVNAIDAWNKAPNSLRDSILKDLTPHKKKIIMKRMIDSD